MFGTKRTYSFDDSLKLFALWSISLCQDWVLNLDTLLSGVWKPESLSQQLPVISTSTRAQFHAFGVDTKNLNQHEIDNDLGDHASQLQVMIGTSWYPIYSNRKRRQCAWSTLGVNTDHPQWTAWANFGQEGCILVPCCDVSVDVYVFSGVRTLKSGMKDSDVNFVFATGHVLFGTAMMHNRYWR